MQRKPTKPEIKCRHSTATNTINTFNEIFSHFEVSDNGTQFMGREFKEFCTSLSTDHVTTAVYHPRSNGKAEKFMDTLIRALRKKKVRTRMKEISRNIWQYTESR